MFQTILRKVFLGNFFFEKMKKNFVNSSFFNIFFFHGQGASSPNTPHGAAPLNPACFWIENPSRNRLALNGISAINPTRYFEHFFFLKII